MTDGGAVSTVIFENKHAYQPTPRGRIIVIATGRARWNPAAITGRLRLQSTCGTSHRERCAVIVIQAQMPSRLRASSRAAPPPVWLIGGAGAD